jgi:hypothetical protein
MGNQGDAAMSNPHDQFDSPPPLGQPSRGSSAGGAIAVVLIVGGMLALLVCGGVVVGSLYIYQQIEAERRMVMQAQMEAEMARAEAEMQRAVAEEQFRQAEQAMNLATADAETLIGLIGDWANVDTGLKYTVMLSGDQPAVVSMSDAAGTACEVRATQWDGSQLTVEYVLPGSDVVQREVVAPDAYGNLSGRYSATDGSGSETIGVSTWQREFPQTGP